MFEEDVSPEVLVKVKKAIFGGLGRLAITSPCCWKVSMLIFISSWLNSLAKGAMILPKRVVLRKRWWLTECPQGYV